MRVTVLIYRVQKKYLEASVAWVDAFTGEVLNSVPVPVSPNLGVFPKQDCALVSYAGFPKGGSPIDWLDVYRFSDWSLQAHLPMDCRAHFNVYPRWSTFLSCQDDQLIYVYKAHTLGDHFAEDYVCGLNLATLSFSAWNFRIPECVSGWSAAGGRAQAQMLFHGDGLEKGKLRFASPEKTMGFWLGPEEGMGPTISLGPRPPAHNDLGRTGAILCASQRPLSVVVCNDGIIHVIDPIDFRYLERQQVKFRYDYAVPLFAAQIDPQGRFLFVGTARDEARHQGLVECVVAHDLERGRRRNEWMLDEPFAHMALTDDGKYLCGVSVKTNKLWVLDARTGLAKSVVQLNGSPRYVIAA